MTLSCKREEMIRVKVSGGKSELSGLLLRQTPGGNGIWGNCQFFVNKPVESCDWWIVCHGSGLLKPESVLCDPEHIVYVSMEPSEKIGCISNGFMQQFSHLVLCDRDVHHNNVRYTNGLTWWVGMSMQHEKGSHRFSGKHTLDYDLLMGMTCPPKVNRISAIVSNKNFLAGHKSRLVFLEELMKHPVGRYIDLFGGGFNPVQDKWDVIAPYKYHLVLENTSKQDYWSEKLADAYLGFSFPFYYGCPNISDYFPEDSYMPIDIGDVRKSADTILKLIDNDAFDQHLTAINAARANVLNRYNIFQIMADTCQVPAEKYIHCSLKPASHFVRYWINQVIRQIQLRVWFMLVP